MKPSKTARGSKPAGKAATLGEDAVTLLKSDHRGVEALFTRFEKAVSSTEKAETAKEVCQQLITHSMIEEEIFYPACREKNVDDDMLGEAQVEHDGAKILIADLVAGSPDDEFYDAKVRVLSEYIKHHVGEEEKPSIGIFAKAQQAGVDMSALGQRLQARKQELMAKAEAGSLRAPMPRSLHLGRQSVQRQEYQEMDRRSQSRDRDDQGRFMSDDDDRGYSRGSSGRSQDRRRDDEGRFMSDDYGRGRSYRSREDDDDDYRRNSSSRGRGHGGWSGDSEGHSEASRRGWEERGGSRSSRRSDDDYDDRGRSARGRDDDDDDRRGSRGRGHGGWFGDPEGHSEASQRGWEERGGSRSSRRSDDDYDDRRRSARSRDDDDDDRRGSRGRGHGGWFGDPEGHSEASQRGWEERGGSRSSRRSNDDDDDRRRSARSRDDDDDDRRGSRGHGGWFGDSDGHSEASRRGWRNRD